MMEPIVNKKKVPRFREPSSNGTSVPAIRLLTHFRSLKDFEVVDKNGYSSLIVYAEKTVNDLRIQMATRSRLLTRTAMNWNSHTKICEELTMKKYVPS